MRDYRLSADGKKLLVQNAGGGWQIVDADKGPPAAGLGTVNLASVQIMVDPRAEFRQMFDEGWRFQRDFLYVPNLQGADYVKTKALYNAMADDVRHRSDLVYLQDMMGGEVAVGHSFVFPGDLPAVPTVNNGLLGADYAIEGGRYRITKIYTGESWNPNLKAPLGAPGIDVNVGDYLLAINGTDVAGTDNIQRLLEGTSGKQTVITVNNRPAPDGAAGSPSSRCRTNPASGSLIGSRATAGRSTSCRAASWRMSICRTPARAATPSSTGTTTPSKTARA